jgi:hypothetical protein
MIRLFLSTCSCTGRFGINGTDHSGVKEFETMISVKSILSADLLKRNLIT